MTCESVILHVRRLHSDSQVYVWCTCITLCVCKYETYNPFTYLAVVADHNEICLGS